MKKNEDNKTVSLRRFERERKARKSSEKLLEEKSLELFETNQEIIKISKNQEKLIEERTAELEIAKNKAVDSSNAKSEFVASMSHEIRTPLNGIIGALSLLKNSAKDREDIELLNIADQSASVLLRIINDILDFSKIEADKMLIENIPFNLVDTFNNIVSTFKEVAIANQVIIKKSYDQQLPIWINGDPYRVTQIVNNFLSNAIKFTKGGEVELVIELDNMDKEKRLRIKIIDNGIGIKEKDLKKLFGSFTQVDSSTTREYGGTGLGLVISKKLAELMSGQVYVESQFKKGSTFGLLLPLLEASEPAAEEELSSEHSKFQERKKILLVDDNEVNRIIGKKILESYGHFTSCVASGQEAIDLFKDRNIESDTRFDIIFMDCQMPDMDGFETTELIRLISEEIPIIALTANTSKEDRKRASNAGMNDFLSKPIRPEQIQEKIYHWC